MPDGTIKITDSRSPVLKLVWGYLRHLEDDGGIYLNVKQGISLGCPLSPLIATIYLKPLDDAMEKSDLFYARFLDDWVVLSPTMEAAQGH